MNIKCPINPEHTTFRIHSFVLYDRDEMINENGTFLYKSDNDSEYSEVVHCYRCKNCEEEDIEWDDKTFDEFQTHCEEQFEHKSKSTRFINRISDIIDGAEDDAL